MKFFLIIPILFWAISSMAGDKPALDPETGFVVDENLIWVKANCTNCHSSKLVIQNRGTEEDWTDLIRWMQEEQGLWPIEASIQKKIVTYLATYYGPEKSGRRKPLVLPTVRGSDKENGDNR